MKRNQEQGFAHLLLPLLILSIGIAGYLVLKTGVTKLPISFPNNDTGQVKEDMPNNVEVDTSRTIFYDSPYFTYRFIEDHNTYLVSKPKGINQMDAPIQELGIYSRVNDQYKLVYKSAYEELWSTLSPLKDYLLIADEVRYQNPATQIYYDLVKSLTIVNIATLDTVSVPFPANRQFAGVLWKLEENKLYITAAKPDGMDYSFKEYYEFNLNSKDFKLIATSDDFILDYGESKLTFAHYILGFSGFDSTRTNIIGVGQAPEDPRLLTVWKINPNTRSFTKIYDYNTDTKYDRLVTDRYIDDRNFKDDKLEVRSETQRYSLDLKNGTITDLKLPYNRETPYVPKFEVNGYEYVSRSRGESYFTLKDINTKKDHVFKMFDTDKYKEFQIITVLD